MSEIVLAGGAGDTGKTSAEEPFHMAGWGMILIAPVPAGVPGVRALPRHLRPVARAQPGELPEAVRGPGFFRTVVQHDRIPAGSGKSQIPSGAVPLRLLSCTERVWIRWLSVIFIIPWAVPSIPTIFSIRFMLNPEWGVINSLIFRLTQMDGPNWLKRPCARASPWRWWCTSGRRCRSGR